MTIGASPRPLQESSLSLPDKSVQSQEWRLEMAACGRAPGFGGAVRDQAIAKSQPRARSMAALGFDFLQRIEHLLLRVGFEYPFASQYSEGNRGKMQRSGQRAPSAWTRRNR